MEKKYSCGEQPTSQEIKNFSVRFPIFKNNKPYMFLKIDKNSEKYRVSLSPEFLKQFNLSFKVLRNKSLENIIRGLNETSRLNTNFNILDFRLPKREKQEVNLVSYIYDLDDNGKDVLKVNKYTFMGTGFNPEETVVLILNREFSGIKEALDNTCVVFVSRKFVLFEEFLKDLDSK